MATPEEIEELRTGLQKLRDNRFNGRWEAMFETYASSDGKMTKADIERVVKIMGFWFAGKWAKGIMEAVDVDKDGLISWPELRSMLDNPLSMIHYELNYLT